MRHLIQHGANLGFMFFAVILQILSHMLVVTILLRQN